MSSPAPTDVIERFVLADDERSHAFRALRGTDAIAPDAAGPGTDVLLMRRQGVPVARASLFTATDLVGAPGVSGLIGHYEARDAASGVALLHEATRQLAGRGVQRVLGPMNGSSWLRYRLALPHAQPAEAAPWFAGEPANDPAYVGHWEAAGFGVCAWYQSRVESLDDMSSRSEEPIRVAGAATSAGAVAADATVRVRPLEVAQFAQELDQLHALSLDAFAGNAYYQPIAREQFRAMYAPFQDRLDPRFVLLAELPSGDAAGFVFAYPDAHAVHEGRPTRLVIKTLAVSSCARGHRISSRLLDTVRANARADGYRQVISALMHEDNTTRGMATRRASTLWRRYALFERAP